LSNGNKICTCFELRSVKQNEDVNEEDKEDMREEDEEKQDEEDDGYDVNMQNLRELTHVSVNICVS
jgi:hypothetical protein